MGNIIFVPPVFRADTPSRNFRRLSMQMNECTIDNLRSRLSIPLGGHEVRALAQQLCQPANAPLVNTVCALLADGDKRVGDNAA